MAFTTLGVARLAKRPGMHHDGKGLWLRVSKTGAASWTFRYMFQRAAHEIGLGPWPDVDLALARSRAAAHRHTLKVDRRDPKAARDVERAAESTAKAKTITFKDAANQYIASHKAGWRSAGHAAQWENSLAAYAFPVVGNLAVADIDTGLVMRVLEPIWTTKSETASRVRNRIELVLSWSRARGYRSGENPARWRGHLDALLPKPSKVQKIEHHPAIPHTEIASFMAELRGSDNIAARALMFTILTAARSSETRLATWKEISGSTWTVPGDRMKGGREHRVPLSADAVAILEAVRPDVAKSDGYIFTRPGSSKPLGKMAMDDVLKRLRPDVSVHGTARSTFRDWCGDNGHPRELAEAALAHRVANETEAAYARSDLLERRRQLMARWASYCSSVDEGQVIPLRA
jgi:integrase